MAVTQEQPQGLLILYNIIDLHESTTSAERPSDSPLHKLISTEILIHFFKTVEVENVKNHFSTEIKPKPNQQPLESCFSFKLR